MTQNESPNWSHVTLIALAATIAPGVLIVFALEPETFAASSGMKVMLLGLSLGAPCFAGNLLVATVCWQMRAQYYGLAPQNRVAMILMMGGGIASLVMYGALGVCAFVGWTWMTLFVAAFALQFFVGGAFVGFTLYDHRRAQRELAAKAEAETVDRSATTVPLSPDPLAKTVADPVQQESLPEADDGNG